MGKVSRQAIRSGYSDVPRRKFGRGADALGALRLGSEESRSLFRVPRSLFRSGNSALTASCPSLRVGLGVNEESAGRGTGAPFLAGPRADERRGPTAHGRGGRLDSYCDSRPTAGPWSSSFVHLESWTSCGGDFGPRWRVRAGGWSLAGPATRQARPGCPLPLALPN